MWFFKNNTLGKDQRKAGKGTSKGNKGKGSRKKRGGTIKTLLGFLTQTGKRQVSVAMIAAAVLILAVALILLNCGGPKPPAILSKSSLEKIVNNSELSTFEAVYNGIAKVMNEEDPQRLDYHVSYDAKIKAGIDFEKVAVSVDHGTKKIIVTLPAVRITDIAVDITTMDYLFENDGANTATVSQQAYHACVEDVTQESERQQAIYVLAERNAENTVEAMLKPFVKQVDEVYTIEICWEEEK